MLARFNRKSARCANGLETGAGECDRLRVDHTALGSGQETEQTFRARTQAGDRTQAGGGGMTPLKHDLAGNSGAFQDVVDFIDKVASRDVTVLIRGENG